MTATDELRRLLDERGVEWQSQDSASDYRNCIVFRTWWNGNCFYEELYHNGDSYTILDLRSIENITPAQAIAATVGRGTCHDTGRYCFTCSACGWIADEPHHFLGGFEPRFCPNCGRQVVDE